MGTRVAFQALIVAFGLGINILVAGDDCVVYKNEGGIVEGPDDGIGLLKDVAQLGEEIKHYRTSGVDGISIKQSSKYLDVSFENEIIYINFSPEYQYWEMYEGFDFRELNTTVKLECSDGSSREILFYGYIDDFSNGYDPEFQDNDEFRFTIPMPFPGGLSVTLNFGNDGNKIVAIDYDRNSNDQSKTDVTFKLTGTGSELFEVVTGSHAQKQYTAELWTKKTLELKETISFQLIATDNDKKPQERSSTATIIIEPDISTMPPSPPIFQQPLYIINATEENNLELEVYFEDGYEESKTTTKISYHSGEDLTPFFTVIKSTKLSVLVHNTTPIPNEILERNFGVMLLEAVTEGVSRTVKTVIQVVLPGNYYIPTTTTSTTTETTTTTDSTTTGSSTTDSSTTDSSTTDSSTTDSSTTDSSTTDSSTTDSSTTDSSTTDSSTTDSSTTDSSTTDSSTTDSSTTDSSTTDSSTTDSSTTDSTDSSTTDSSTTDSSTTDSSTTDSSTTDSSTTDSSTTDSSTTDSSTTDSSTTDSSTTDSSTTDSSTTDSSTTDSSTTDSSTTDSSTTDFSTTDSSTTDSSTTDSSTTDSSTTDSSTTDSSTTDSSTIDSSTTDSTDSSTTDSSTTDSSTTDSSTTDSSTTYSSTTDSSTTDSSTIDSSTTDSTDSSTTDSSTTDSSTTDSSTTDSSTTDSSTTDSSTTDSSTTDSSTTDSSTTDSSTTDTSTTDSSTTDSSTTDSSTTDSSTTDSSTTDSSTTDSSTTDSSTTDSSTTDSSTTDSSTTDSSTTDSSTTDSSTTDSSTTDSSTTDSSTDSSTTDSSTTGSSTDSSTVDSSTTGSSTTDSNTTSTTDSSTTNSNNTDPSPTADPPVDNLWDYSVLVINLKETNATSVLLAHSGTNYGDCKFSKEVDPYEAESLFDISDKGTVSTAAPIDRESKIFALSNIVRIKLFKKCKNSEDPYKLSRDVSSHSLWNIGSQRVEYNVSSEENAMLLVVKIEDVNDNRPYFSKSSVTVGYPSKDLAKELLPPYLITVQAEDKDIGENAKIEYMIERKYKQTKDDNDDDEDDDEKDDDDEENEDVQFVVHKDSGVVYPRQDTFRYKPTSFTVIARDSFDAGGSLQINVKILSKDNMAIIIQQGSTLEDTESILKSLQKAADLKDVQALSAAVVADEEYDQRRKSGGKEGSHTLLRLVVYALDEKEQLVSASRIVKAAQKSPGILKAEQWKPILITTQSNGLLIAVIILGILLLLSAATMAFLAYRMRNPKEPNANFFNGATNSSALPWWKKKIWSGKCFGSPYDNFSGVSTNQGSVCSVDATIAKSFEKDAHLPTMSVEKETVVDGSTADSTRSSVNLGNQIGESEDAISEGGGKDSLARRKSLVTFNDNVQQIEIEKL